MFRDIGYRSLPVTSRQYIDSIYAHSQRSIVTSSFPGQNYIDLANWLLQGHSGPGTLYSTVTNRDRHHLAVFQNLDQLGPEKTPLLLTQSELPRLTCHPAPEREKGHVLFLRGFLSPQWIAEVGSRYRVDAEFFHRHLDFFASSVHRSCFGLPSLPNTSNNIIHIIINTIICNHHSPSIPTDDLLDRRSEAAEHMVRYKRQLQTSARCGDSLVREYSVLDGQFSVIEQRVSVCICRNSDGWLGKLFAKPYELLLTAYSTCLDGQWYESERFAAWTMDRQLWSRDICFTSHSTSSQNDITENWRE